MVAHQSTRTNSMRESDRDPRRDLKEDHDLWVKVLVTAYINGQHHLHGLLHGLRCAGARLYVQNGRLRLDYKAMFKNKMFAKAFTEEEILENWLEPMKSQIANLFKKAYRMG